MPVELTRKGLKLTGSPLWLDATRKTELSFVSHAHADHIAAHERIIATKETLALIAHRLKRRSAELPVPYCQPFALGPLTLELLGAGHMLGAAQLAVTKDDGHRITFSGDVCFEPTRTAAPATVAPCDTLVLESTFGHPRFSFPKREEVLGDMTHWCQRQHSRGLVPILYAYAAGKSQEVIAHLNAQGLPVCAHDSICDIADIYSNHGVPLLVRRFAGTVLPGEVGLFPPFGRSMSLKAIPNTITAVLTGWATDAEAVKRYRADHAFPLSDHADCRALVRYAKETGAREVITHHGYAEELAQALRKAGVQARAVSRPLQLSLELAAS